MRPTHGEPAVRLWSLIDPPVERVLVSHGEPVLSDARERLRAAVRRS